MVRQRSSYLLLWIFLTIVDGGEWDVCCQLIRAFVKKTKTFWGTWSKLFTVFSFHALALRLDFFGLLWTSFDVSWRHLLLPRDKAGFVHLSIYLLSLAGTEPTNFCLEVTKIKIYNKHLNRVQAVIRSLASVFFKRRINFLVKNIKNQETNSARLHGISCDGGKALKISAGWTKI